MLKLPLGQNRKPEFFIKFIVFIEKTPFLSHLSTNRSNSKQFCNKN